MRLLVFLLLLLPVNCFAYNAAFFNVPANTPQETIVDEFSNTFPGLTIPEGGIMPTSHVGAGRHIVYCILHYSYEETVQLLDDSGKNWQLWGFQSATNLIPAHCTDNLYTEQEICEIAGEDWIPVAPLVTIPINRSVLNFLNDVLVGDPPTPQAATEANTPLYQGHAQHVFALP